MWPRRGTPGGEPECRTAGRLVTPGVRAPQDVAEARHSGWGAGVSDRWSTRDTRRPGASGRGGHGPGGGVEADAVAVVVRLERIVERGEGTVARGVVGAGEHPAPGTGVAKEGDRVGGRSAPAE